MSKSLLPATVATVIALTAAVVAFAPRPVPADPSPLPETSGSRSASTSCDADAIAPPHVPAGWRAHVDTDACIAFLHPADLPAPTSSAPNALHRLDPDDLSTYASVRIADAATDGADCHRTPFVYGADCVTLDEVRGSYHAVDDARGDAFIGPEVRVRCDIGAECVVREAHVVTGAGRWIAVTAYVAEAAYDDGFAEDLLRIVRSIDAR